MFRLFRSARPEFGLSFLPETLGFQGSELWDNTTLWLRSVLMFAPIGTASLPEIFLFELLNAFSLSGRAFEPKGEILLLPTFKLLGL